MGLFDDLLGLDLETKLKKPLKKLTDRQYEIITEKIVENLRSDVTPSQEDSPEAIQHRRDRARADREWAKHYYFPHYFTKPSGQVHRDMHEMMHKGDKSIVAFVMPRDHGKTTHGSFADTILDALEEICPYQIIIWGNADTGIMFLRWVKFELENNARLRQDYGDELISYSKDSEIEIKGRALIQTLGARQKIRGLKYKNHRPTRVIAEDIDDDETVRNPKRCERVLKWILAAIYPAIDDDGVFVMIGTSISRYSTIMQLIQYIKEKAEEFEAEHGHQRLYSRVYRAIIDEGTERERALWPEGKSLKKLKEIRDIVGPVVWAGEYQNDPIDDAMFPPAWDTYYDRSIFINPDRRWVYGSGTDPSAGASDKNCFKAHIVLAKDLLNPDTLYCAEAWIKKTTIPDMIRKYVELAWEYDIKLGVFETNGYQAYIKDVLVDELFRKGKFMTIREVVNTLDKVFRIQTMAGPYQKGRLQFCKGHSDQDLLREQFHHLGASSEVDGPDAMEMIYREIQKWNPKFSGKVGTAVRRTVGKIAGYIGRGSGRLGGLRPTASIRSQYLG